MMHKRGATEEMLVPISVPLCHFNNPDLDVGYEAYERVCRRVNRHTGPHAGIVGRSRWLYPSQPSTLVPVNHRTAEELIALMDRP